MKTVGCFVSVFQRAVPWAESAVNRKAVEFRFGAVLLKSAVGGNVLLTLQGTGVFASSKNLGGTAVYSSHTSFRRMGLF